MDSVKHDMSLVYRACIAYALMGSVEVWGQIVNPSYPYRFAVSLALLALLFWQFAKRRAWAKWVIAALIVAGFGNGIYTAYRIRTVNALIRVFVLGLICILSLLVVLWPWPKTSHKTMTTDTTPPGVP